MKGVFGWLNEKENRFFAMHVAAVLVLALLFEAIAPYWTIFAYPAVLLIVVASFMFNYPADAIKTHGLFSEYLIELRLLWLIILGVFLEYLLYQVIEKNAITLQAAIALLIGIFILFYARSHMQEKIVKARGFN